MSRIKDILDTIWDIIVFLGIITYTIIAIALFIIFAAFLCSIPFLIILGVIKIVVFAFGLL